MQAIGKYPYFCDDIGDYLLDDGYTKDEACQRELAFMFAHFNQETGAHDSWSEVPFWRQQFAHITEWACTDPQSADYCDYA